MQFVLGNTFADAVRKLDRRSVIGARLNSSEWSDVPVALRDRAFFSSMVESVRFLQRAKDALGSFLKSATEQTPGGPALQTGSRADFVKQMQDFLKAEGITRTSGDIKDLAGERRLALIFDTQVRQASEFGQWRQGMDPDVLDLFPAQRFIRVVDVKEPRTAHLDFEGQVYLKTDPIWSTINQDFGVPWGPWGWGCGHDVEDVDRSEAEELGLLEKDAPVSRTAERDFNARLEAGLTGLDDDLVSFLKERLGNLVEISGRTVKWSGRPKARSKRDQGAAGPAPAREPRAQAVFERLATHAARLGFHKTIAAAIRSLPPALADKMTFTLKTTQSGAYYRRSEKTVYLNDNPSRWGSQPSSLYHEIGHHFHHVTGAVHGDADGRLLVADGLKRAMAADLRSFERKAKARFGENWEEALSPYNAVESVGGWFKLKTDPRIDLEQAYRVSRICDTVMGLTKGRLGAGHSRDYMERVGAMEVYAHAVSALLSGDRIWKALFRSTLEWVKNDLKL